MPTLDARRIHYSRLKLKGLKDLQLKALTTRQVPIEIEVAVTAPLQQGSVETYRGHKRPGTWP